MLVVNYDYSNRFQCQVMKYKYYKYSYRHHKLLFELLLSAVPDLLGLTPLVSVVADPICKLCTLCKICTL